MTHTYFMRMPPRTRLKDENSIKINFAHHSVVQKISVIPFLQNYQWLKELCSKRFFCFLCRESKSTSINNECEVNEQVFKNRKIEILYVPMGPYIFYTFFALFVV